MIAIPAASARLRQGALWSPFVDLGSGFSVNYLAFDGAGNLYTDDVTGHRILAITPGGSVSTFATLPSDADPYDLAFDRLGNLYVTNARSSGSIFQITPSGVVSTFATGGLHLPDCIVMAPAYSTLVPEPSTLTLLGVGAVSLLTYGWRRRAA